MAKIKISELDAAATLDGTEEIPIVQDGETVKTTAQDIADLGGSSYLVYTALLSQSSTDAPTATVLENTLGGTVVWTRDIQGAYTGTLAGVFTANKTLAIISSNSGFNMLLDRGGDDTVILYTYNGSGILTDSLLNNTSVEIRVYP